MSAWDKNIGEIIAELKMMRTEFKGFFWLVEGPSDIRFFEHRKGNDIELIAAGGKRNVIDTIRSLQDDSLSHRILGIVDADIDWLIPPKDIPANIVSTDPRDLEGILLRSRALEKLLSEYADARKINNFERREGKTVRDFVHDTSEFFGKIRAVNNMTNNVSLKKIKPQMFMLKGKWGYDYRAALEFFVTKGVSESVEELESLTERLPKNLPWHYVRGHDAINILTGGLVSEIGRGGRIDDSRIESALRIGIEDNEYHSSKIYNDLEQWKINNSVGVV